MFSYQSHRRFEKVRKKGELYRQYNSEERKPLFLFKENQLLNCWRFEKWYERLDGEALHQLWARGEGPIVRHLCSEGRCINPIHLMRGTDLDNAKDEIEVRDFENKLMMDILDDYSMEGEDKTLIHLTLLPKVSIKQIDELGVRSLREVNKHLRELFRKDYVQRLISNSRAISEDDIQSAAIKLTSLMDRPDISIITVPGR